MKTKPDMMSGQTMSETMDYHELEERVVQETEIHDTLSDVESFIRSVETDFVRITVEPVTADKHQANQRLAQAVAETDVCLSCGEPIDEGGFCNYTCLTSWGGEDE